MDWKKAHAKGKKHAALMRRKPELRRALWGAGSTDRDEQPPDIQGLQGKETRETAQKDGRR